jgi:hypothetical protein
MIDLPKIKARVARLKELEDGLAAELDAWNGRDSRLSPGEWQHYREGIEWAVAGLFDAREVHAVPLAGGRQTGRPLAPLRLIFGPHRGLKH